MNWKDPRQTGKWNKTTQEEFVEQLQSVITDAQTMCEELLADRSSRDPNGWVSKIVPILKTIERAWVDLTFLDGDPTMTEQE